MGEKSGLLENRFGDSLKSVGRGWENGHNTINCRLAVYDDKGGSTRVIRSTHANDIFLIATNKKK